MSKVNIGGSWKDLDKVFCNIGGVWKEVEKMFTNIGGVWKEVEGLGVSRLFMIEKISSGMNWVELNENTLTSISSMSIVTPHYNFGSTQGKLLSLSNTKSLIQLNPDTFATISTHSLTYNTDYIDGTNDWLYAFRREWGDDEWGAWDDKYIRQLNPTTYAHVKSVKFNDDSFYGWNRIAGTSSNLYIYTSRISESLWRFNNDTLIPSIIGTLNSNSNNRWTLGIFGTKDKLFSNEGTIYTGFITERNPTNGAIINERIFSSPATSKPEELAGLK